MTILISSKVVGGLVLIAIFAFAAYAGGISRQMSRFYDVLARSIEFPRDAHFVEELVAQPPLYDMGVQEPPNSISHYRLAM